MQAFRGFDKGRKRVGSIIKTVRYSLENDLLYMYELWYIQSTSIYN